MGVQWNRRATHAIVVLAACVVPASVSAQAVVRGFVYDDSTGLRIPGAAVMLVDARTDAAVVNTKTDSLGEFVLKTRQGLFQIAAVREGYNSVLSAPVPLAEGEQLMIRFPIAVGADPRNKIGVLEHVKPNAVPVRSALEESPQLAAMERRRTVGTGLQYTRAQMDESQASTVGDLLRRVPGVSMSSGNATETVQIRRGGSATFGSRTPPSLVCHVGWFLDGVRIDRPGASPMTEGLSSIRLDELEGLEVFRGVSEMPPEFAAPDLRCGAVALWTRHR